MTLPKDRKIWKWLFTLAYSLYICCIFIYFHDRVLLHEWVLFTMNAALVSVQASITQHSEWGNSGWVHFLHFMEHTWNYRNEHGNECSNCTQSTILWMSLLQISSFVLSYRKYEYFIDQTRYIRWYIDHLNHNTLKI